nr:anti-SIV gp148 Ig heavy chain {CDR3 heavy chain region} [Macaca fascicularis=cynomolgus monkey, Peptide Partial, 23 aa] [Macaca fascicularis]
YYCARVGGDYSASYFRIWGQGVL